MRWVKIAWTCFLLVLGALSYFGVPLPRDWKSTAVWLTWTDAWLQRHAAYPGTFLLFTALLVGTVIAPSAYQLIRERLIPRSLKPDVGIAKVVDYIVNDSRAVLRKPGPAKLMEYGPAKGHLLTEAGVEHQDALNKVNEMLAAGKLTAWGLRSLEINIENRFETYRREIPTVQWEKIQLHPFTCLFRTEMASQTVVLPRTQETYHWTGLEVSWAQVCELWPRKSGYRRVLSRFGREPQISPRPGINLDG